MTNFTAGWPELRRSLSRSKLRDAARLGVQSAAAAVATLVLLAMVGVEERFLGVISAALVLDPSRDATLANAAQRIIATFVGSAVGGLGLLLAPRGQLASMAIVMLLMGAIVIAKPQWRYGLVAAAGLAIVAESQVWATALNRVTAIFVGAGAGIIAGLVIWPKTARGYAVGHLREAITTCNELLRRTIDLAVEDSDADLSSLHTAFSRQIARAGSAVESVRLARGGQKQVLGEAVHRVERLWHALIILDRVGETKSRISIFDQDRSALVQKLKEQCCEALACLEQLDPVPAACLDAIDRSCVRLDPLQLDEADPDRVEQLGLAYGLHEVARNIRELSEAIPDVKMHSA